MQEKHKYSNLHKLNLATIEMLKFIQFNHSMHINFNQVQKQNKIMGTLKLKLWW